MEENMETGILRRVYVQRDSVSRLVWVAGIMICSDRTVGLLMGAPLALW